MMILSAKGKLNGLFFSIAWKKTVDFWKETRGRSTLGGKDETLIRLVHYEFEMHKASLMIQGMPLEWLNIDWLNEVLRRFPVTTSGEEEMKDFPFQHFLIPLFEKVKQKLLEKGVYDNSLPTKELMALYLKLNTKRIQLSEETNPANRRGVPISDKVAAENAHVEETDPRPEDFEALQRNPCWQTLPALKKKILTLSYEPLPSREILKELSIKFGLTEPLLARLAVHPGDFEQVVEDCHRKRLDGQKLSPAEQELLQLQRKTRSDKQVLAILRQEREDRNIPGLIDECFPNRRRLFDHPLTFDQLKEYRDLFSKFGKTGRHDLIPVPFTADDLERLSLAYQKVKEVLDEEGIWALAATLNPGNLKVHRFEAKRKLSECLA